MFDGTFDEPLKVFHFLLWLAVELIPKVLER